MNAYEMIKKIKGDVEIINGCIDDINRLSGDNNETIVRTLIFKNEINCELLEKLNKIEDLKLAIMNTDGITQMLLEEYLNILYKETNDYLVRNGFEKLTDTYIVV